ncbi:MAG: hypothetical protein F4W95_06150 [Chloroflexi bacterium]|nr:hypothetical protein [Chloroflexota bacterium]MYD48050.1 hypothetical protein [Chloroflexota bacterium]
MPIYPTFKKRKQQAENAGEPVIYRDDVLPDPFRIQVAHIWQDTIGNDDGWRSARVLTADRIWENMHRTLAREMGEFRLWDSKMSNRRGCELFLLRRADVDDVLSLIELSFREVDGEMREKQTRAQYSTDWQSADDAIAELNHRFREHGIGYQFQGGQIIAVNSQYLHSEVVEPAISLLHDANFGGALEEFMAAHKHYREGNYRDTIINAGNAFESTMKIICDRRNWVYNTKPSASKLVRVLFDNDLLPSELESHFSGLRSALESGVPTLRNQPGRAHGQGSLSVEVHDYLAEYCLHLTAANIVFLVEAHNAKP